MERRHSRRGLLGTAAAVGFGALCGCLGDESTAQQQDDEGWEVTVGPPRDPTGDSWDTAYGGVMPYYTRILEPLVWTSEEMTPKPWLATDWEAVDETTWEFTLREEVQFHNGEPLTAEAVVWSFKHLFETEGSYVEGWLHLRPEGIEAVDDRTVSFTNTDPFPTFPGTIAHNMVAIQHPETGHGADVIATGPLRVERYDRTQQIRTVPFEAYWGERPAVDALTFKTVDDPNTRTLSLESGELDVAFDPPRSQLESLAADDSIRLERTTGTETTFVAVNLHRSPTDDPDLRRALNYAVSQEELIDSILEGVGSPARGPFSPTIDWGVVDPLPSYEQDRARARDLVADSAYDGEELRLATYSTLVDGRQLAEALQGAFADIGVTVAVNIIDESSFWDVTFSGETHLNLLQLGSNSVAADFRMFDSFHSEGQNNVRLFEEHGTGLYNLGGEVDDLIEQGYQTSDPETKADAYREAQIAMAEAAITVPISYDEYVVATDADLTGIDLVAIDTMVEWADLRRAE